MTLRRAVSIIELLMAVAIVAVLIGLLLPAMNAVRRRANEAVCQNNVRQINLAVAHYYELQKQLPPPVNGNVIGGWSIEILPFLEQRNLRDRVTPGGPVSAAPDFLLKPPRLLSCPTRAMTDPPTAGMRPAHYVLVPGPGRKSYHLFEMPLEVSVAWVGGPEMAFADVIRQTGPHNRGFYYSNGFMDGVTYRPHYSEGR